MDDEPKIDLRESTKRNFGIHYDTTIKKFRKIPEPCSDGSDEFYSSDETVCYDKEETLRVNLEGVSDNFNCRLSFSDKLVSISDLSVKCLSTLEELEAICENLGLKFTNCHEPEKEDVYEVELILGHKVEEGESLYHVKWKNYPLSQNTWEPKTHLDTNCEKMVWYYHYLKSCTSSTKLNHKMFSHFVHDLTIRKPLDVLCLSILCSIFFGLDKSHYMSLTYSKLRENARTIVKGPFSRVMDNASQIIALMKFSEERKYSLIILEEWKYEINAYNPNAYIEVENNVDLEVISKHFQFIHDYISKDVIAPAEPVIFCHCNDCLKEKSSCCPIESDAHFAYNRYGRLQLLPGYPIYECNKLCKCGPDCSNRVVQHGQKVKVSIFKTSNGCGWGLKTLETIQKDQFVLEYLGEILTSEDAEERGNLYDIIGRSYLFDLDYGERNCLYTVDAGQAGNAAHFINHSCDPNLHVFAVWIDNQNPNLPRLAFFAKRKILRGEELTFDYKMVKHTETGEMERISCKCNSKNCRKFLY